MSHSHGRQYSIFSPPAFEKAVVQDTLPGGRGRDVREERLPHRSQAVHYSSTLWASDVGVEDRVPLRAVP